MPRTLRPSKMLKSPLLCWVLAEMVFVPSGSHSTRSASAPGPMKPFRGGMVDRRGAVGRGGGVGGGVGKDFAGGQAPAVHAGVPDDGHALFHAAGAIGDVGEVLLAHGFLRGAK